MALIKCPECGGQVSDKASACIHCGCPLSKLDEKKNICKVNGKEFNLEKIKNLFNLLPNDCKDITYRNYCINATEKDTFTTLKFPSKYSNKECNDFEDIQYNIRYPIQEEFNWFHENTYLCFKFLMECIDHNFEYFEFNTSNIPSPQPTNQLKCPRCGSTSIVPEKRGYDIMWGFLGSERIIYNVCQKCGYKWKLGK